VSWLVTGGAGYIGAHVARSLIANGIQPVVFDDLSTGQREFVPAGVSFVEGSILDTPALEHAIRLHAVTGVMHIAGMKFASISVQRPLDAYSTNVTGTASVLAAMSATGVDKIVFSSSAAVYGTPSVDRAVETTPTRPETPYGESKLAAEWLIRAQASAVGLRQVSLRYFNVVGAAADGVRDTSPYSLLALVLAAVSEGRAPTIFGADYPTVDGTCIRDFVDVGELAKVHAVAASALEEGRVLQPVYNLGVGHGTTVRQFIDTVSDVLGVEILPVLGPRRPGDPVKVVAESELARRDLGWTGSTPLRESIARAWAAYSSDEGH